MWFRLRLAWYRADKGAWLFVLVLALIVALLAFLTHAVFMEQDALQRRAREMMRQNLACLARNIYFEARGEPLAGQYAVAEVTMNRAASGLFPKNVCAVVYQKSAFSWTDLDGLPEPSGEEWTRALKVAEAVYFRQREPQLPTALYYHADDIKPDWARFKRRVAHIGAHVFYR